MRMRSLQRSTRSDGSGSGFQWKKRGII
jgi:hypothetical protein